MSDGSVARSRQGAFRAITQVSGWNYHPHHIALRPSLEYKIISQLCFDWMHVWVAQGVSEKELNALMNHRPALCSSVELGAYVSKWTWLNKS